MRSGMALVCVALCVCVCVCVCDENVCGVCLWVFCAFRVFCVLCVLCVHLSVYRYCTHKGRSRRHIAFCTIWHHSVTPVCVCVCVSVVCVVCVCGVCVCVVCVCVCVWEREREREREREGGRESPQPAAKALRRKWTICLFLLTHLQYARLTCKSKQQIQPEKLNFTSRLHSKAQTLVHYCICAIYMIYM